MNTNSGAGDGAKKPSAANGIKQTVIKILKGAVIGVGAILPGISGGVLCIAFGIYKPMMSFLSHPIKSFKKYFSLLLPILIGWAVGFLALARLVDVLFRNYQVPSTWLFIGLIAGTVPSIYRQAGEQGRKAGSWIAFGVSLTLFLGWMFFLSMNNAISVEPSVFWWLVCGLLWGIGMIVPGMSPSSFLIYLGLYQPMTAGIADFRPDVILPIIAGAGLVVLLLARLVNWLFSKAHSIVSHALMGIVIASTIAIIPWRAAYGPVEITVSAVCFAAGLAVTLIMDRFSSRYSEETA